MKEIGSWWYWMARRRETHFRPWAIIGKGPTFADAAGVDWSGYQTIGLNHVAREMCVDVAHVIDLDVIEQVDLDDWLRCDAVVMPWRPHVNSTVGEQSLEEHAGELPALAALAEAGKLVYYNLAGGGRPADCVKRRGPAVGVRYYSSEAAFNLLCACGVRRISICGIDGRDSYARSFDDLTPFANGRKSFDEGIGELIRIARLHRVAVDRLPLERRDADALTYRYLYIQEPGYGSKNHGAAAVPLLAERLKARSVLDVGCGDNSFARQLRRRGIVAWGADIASPWADLRFPADRLPFDAGQMEWVTSFDMLEHLSPAQVPVVLDEFRRIASRGWLLSICTRPSDTPGPNGEVLHRTVEPLDWWHEQIARQGMTCRDVDGLLLCEPEKECR